jgi:hypothetical protein
MIRAVVKQGVIQPLEPLPAEWKDGQEVVVDDLKEPSPIETEDIDAWSEELKALTAGLNDPEEWKQIEAALAEADRQSKALPASFFGRDWLGWRREFW